MKKIEVVIDRVTLEDVKLRLGKAGIDGRLTVTEVKSTENLCQYYDHRKTGQDQWKPCLKIDLIVSDRQTKSAVNIILRHANLGSAGGSCGHINILPLDATLEIGTENLQPPPEAKEIAIASAALKGAISPGGPRSECGKLTPVESWPTANPHRA